MAVLEVADNGVVSYRNELQDCYGPSVISVTVTKGGHPRGGGLYGTSGTIGQGVSQVT